MYQRKDGLWVDTLPRPGKSPKFFYAKTKTDLKAKIRAWSEDQEKGVTMQQAIEEWLVMKEKQVSWNTYEGYKSSIKRINEVFGDKSLKDITPAELQAFFNMLAARGYGKKLVCRHHDILNMVYDFNIVKPDAQIRYNPMSAVKIPAGLKSERRDLPDEADIAIVKNSVGDPFGLFAFLCIYTGCRKGEALALMDTDFKDGEISISKEVSWQPNQPVIKPPKTASSVRKVPLLTPLQEHLPKWKGYLFSEDGGKTPLTRNVFVARWAAYCKRVGLADEEKVLTKHCKNGVDVYHTEWRYHLVPHQLRHEYATILLDADLTAKESAELLGHSSTQTTEAIYQHIRDSRREERTKKLNEFVTNNY